MTRDLKASLTIDAKDRASDTVRRVSSRAQAEADRVGARTKKAAEDGARAQERAAQRSQNTYTRQARAREQLGIRSESRIRREIVQTEAAYNRLARTGRLSAAEQSRAYGQMQNRVAGLRREMVGLERDQSRTGRAGSMALRAGKYLMAGGAAGGAVVAARQLAQPIGRTLSYQQRLSYMATTAFPDRDVEGKKQGVDELQQAVDRAVRVGLGSRDQAANALESLLNAGAVSQKDAFSLLPTVQSVAVGSNADTGDVATVVNTLVRTFGIATKEIPAALDMFVQASKAGSIEFQDLARGMPGILANAGKAGMSGTADLAALLSATEGAAATAGSPEQAMTNMTNWLSKLNSQDSIRAAEKIEWKPGKSIDLVGTLAKYRGEGMNTLEAYNKIIDTVVARDKRFAAISEKLKTAAPGEQQALLESQQSLFEGSAIGKLLPDQQAVLGYLSFRNTPAAARKSSRDDVFNSAGANAADMAFLSTVPAFKVQRATNEAQSAEYNGFKNLSGVVGDFAGKFADLAAEYPSMTTAAVLATDALKALALVAGSAMLLGALRGRGAGALAAGRGTMGAAASGAAVGGSRALAGRFGKYGVTGPLLAAGGAYGAYQIMSDDQLSGSQKTDALVDQGSRTAGQIGGAYAGAAAGSFLFGPLGTVVGGLAGGVAGNYLGDELAQRITGMMSGPPLTPQEMQARMRGGVNMATGGVRAEDLQAAIIAGKKEPQAIDLKVTVQVQNGEITAAVNEVNERTSRRN